MKTTIQAGVNGGVVFVVNGVECPLSREEADLLKRELTEKGTEAAKQVAHKIEEAQI